MAETELPVNDLENELTELIDKHHLNPTMTPTRFIARYLIRQIDNYREMEQEAQSDYSRQQSRMGSKSKETGNN